MARMMVSLIVIEFAPMTALSVTAGAVAEEGLGLNAALERFKPTLIRIIPPSRVVEAAPRALR